MDERGRAVARAVAAGVIGVLATAAAWYRLGPVTRSTVWAEDGGVFLRERLALGPWDLLQPYAGYLHLVPRLVVDLAAALPVDRYAHVVSAVSCAVVGTVAALVFVLARDVVRPVAVRVLLAAVPVLLPLAPYEISGNAANLHWYLLFLAPWLYVARPRSWWSAGPLAVVTALVVLSEPQTVLFLPLLLLAWFPRRRDGTARLALPVTVVALLGSAAQAVTALVTERVSRPGSPAPSDVLAGYLLQPVAGAWDPDVGAAVGAVLDHGWAVLLVPAAALLVLLAAAVVVGPLRARWMVVALAGASIAVWTAALVANGSAGQPWSTPSPAMTGLPPQRYAAAAGMLLLGSVVVAAGALVDGARWSLRGARRGPRWARVAGALAGGCLVLLVVLAGVRAAGPQETRRSDGPVWAAQIPAAVAACRADPTLVEVDVRTAPWSAQVPCTMLVGLP